MGAPLVQRLRLRQFLTETEAGRAAKSELHAEGAGELEPFLQSRVSAVRSRNERERTFPAVELTLSPRTFTIEYAPGKRRLTHRAGKTPRGDNDCSTPIDTASDIIGGDGMRGRFALAILILGTSAILQAARQNLVGVEDKLIEAWPAQIIFGFYFAVLTITVGALQKTVSRKSNTSADAVLLLLVLISLCLDLVLNNLFETISHPDASYGLVILWDVTTFFVWLRTIELCVDSDSARFDVSWLIALAPLFKLGREILSLPYAPPAGRAYLDLLFGDAAVCLWLFIPGTKTRGTEWRWFRVLVRVVVISGCLYWFMTAAENILFIAWPPLKMKLFSSLTTLGAPATALNYAYFVSGAALSLVIWRFDVWNTATLLGLVESHDREDLGAETEAGRAAKLACKE